ncbi:MAG: hypothetical protein LH606_21540, partial [Cytophagaceae bacterium]|nr:hypothetical protein [Cytophagaceae bacterium]
GTTKLNGSSFGTSGTDGSNGFGAAFDGNIGTWWHGIFPGSNNFAGLHLSGCGSGGRRAADAVMNEETTPNGLQLMPNPASEYVELRLTAGERLRRAQCLDVQGRVVVETEQPRLYIGRLPGGTYLIRAETTAGRTYSRVLVKP